MAEHRFTFTTSGDDASNISIALDFYIRVLIGQYDVLSGNSYCLSEVGGIYSGSEADKFLLQIRDILLPELSEYGPYGSHGVYSPHRDIRAGEAYNIYQELRYRRAYFEHPEGGYSVEFDTPLWAKDDPFPHPEVSCHLDIYDKPRAAFTLCKEQLQIILDALDMYLSYLQHHYFGLFSYLSSDSDVLECAKKIEKICEEEQVSAEDMEWQKKRISDFEETRKLVYRKDRQSWIMQEFGQSEEEVASQHTQEFQRGVTTGKPEGEARFASLIRVMSKDGDVEDFEKVANDVAFREEMYKKYSL